jgi:NTE family protein
MLNARGGIFPRREIKIVVDQAACTGCALCVARAPDIMTIDAALKAHPITPRHEWSPADGAFVRCCPVGAIHVVEPTANVWRDDGPPPIFPEASSVPSVHQHGGSAAR